MDPASTIPTLGVALAPALEPLLTQILDLHTPMNANRTPKNLKMIETRTRSLSRSTVFAQVSSTTRYSMTYW